MPDLMLRFAVHLKRNDFPDYVAPEGPYFHRWLPDGEVDAVSIAKEGASISVKLWFERTGYVDGGWIRYDPKRSEIDPKIMCRQGKIQAGRLRGNAIVNILDDDELSAIVNNSEGSDKYISAAKKIIRLLHPILHNFIITLQTKYGQYWLKTLKYWDSRGESIGSYCSSGLSLHWSNDGGSTWNRFKPGELSVHISAGGRNFEEYVTAKDWNEIKTGFSSTRIASLASIILLGAHEFEDQEQYRQAFIEGTTALEIAINEYIRKRTTVNPIIDSVQPFFSLPIHTQLSTLAVGCNLINNDDVNYAIAAIRIRNEIVHEGKHPSDDNVKLLPPLFRVVAAFLEDGTYKFPSINGGNVQYPDECQTKAT